MNFTNLLLSKPVKECHYTSNKNSCNTVCEKRVDVSLRDDKSGKAEPRKMERIDGDFRHEYSQKIEDNNICQYRKKPHCDEVKRKADNA